MTARERPPGAVYVKLRLTESAAMEKYAVHCLLCNRPQQCITTHLHRVCMRGNTQQEVAEEAFRATASQKKFGREGRVWDFADLEGYCKDLVACQNLCSVLQSRGFIIVNTPGAGASVLASERTERDVLAVARTDIQQIQQKFVSGSDVPQTSATLLRLYCEAVLMWKHRLTGKSVKSLSVTDWLDRKNVGDDACVVHVGSKGKESITLSAEEESILECYASSIRPLSLQRQADKSDDQGRFFVGETGAPLNNLAQDLQRLKAKYLEPESVAGTSSDPLTGQASAPMLLTALSSVQEWDAFRTAFPVTLNGKAPSAEKCSQAGFPRHRTLYKKWRELQLQQRTSYILGHSLARVSGAPSEERVQLALDKETTWTTNKPKVHDIMRAWVAPPEPQPHKREFVIASVMSQKWKGLALKDFGAAKGRGVVVMLPFSKGDVVCDYHGTIISEAEGRQKEQSGFLFFFKGQKGDALCFDATESPCACHPDVDTFGRMINHSRKMPNLKPERHLVDFPDGPRETVLFIAKRNIKIGEELFWDYGVKRTSFGGEGRDLEWLDI